MRELRDEVIEVQLKEGRTVAYRSSGWSLYPRVRSGDLCCYKPARFEGQTEEGGIVFCKVQPAHLIHHAERNKATRLTDGLSAGSVT